MSLSKEGRVAISQPKVDTDQVEGLSGILGPNQPSEGVVRLTDAVDMDVWCYRRLPHCRMRLSSNSARVQQPSLSYHALSIHVLYGGQGVIT